MYARADEQVFLCIYIKGPNTIVQCRKKTIKHILLLQVFGSFIKLNVFCLDNNLIVIYRPPRSSYLLFRIRLLSDCAGMKTIACGH